MWSALKESWTLFIGMAFLMISNGLLATLLTLRASSLGFSDGTIGLMQSAYPPGTLFGCLYAPRLVGHPATLHSFFLGKALRWPFRTPGRRVSTNSPRTGILTDCKNAFSLYKGAQCFTFL
jgi:hypothetical protein